jgi:hypothetical protein
MVSFIPFLRHGRMAAIAAIVATAAHASDIDTSLGGFVKLQYGAADRNSSADGVRLDGEAHLDLSGQTDTGVTYGARLQFPDDAKPRDNGAFVEAGWVWGEFRLGDYGGAAKELTVSAPTIGIGQIDGDFDRFGGPSTLIAPYKLDNDDSAKLTYLSPAVYGIRLGVSYTPELSAAPGDFSLTRGVAPNARPRNVTEVAINVSRDIGEATMTSGAAYVLGSAAAGSHLHDLSGFSTGTKIAWNGFTIGGGFVYDGAATLPFDPRPGHRSVESIVDEINFGATYETGRWGFGASWAHDNRKALAATDIVSAGLVYRIAKGVTAAADLAHYTQPAGPADNAVIVETAVHF